MVILFIFAISMFFSILVISIKNPKIVATEAEVKSLITGEISVSFLPLSRGEATLIQLDNNDFYLIDTGDIDTKEELNILLRNHGVTKLKGVFLSNFSKDHIGGLNVLLQQFAVDTFYIPELIANSFSIPKNGYTKIKKLKQDDKIIINHDVNINILAPSEPLSLSPQANSLVLQLTHKEVRFLFTGDINGEIEKRLQDRYNLRSQILKVSDYGGDNSSTSSFIKEVDAQVAIVFNSDSKLSRISDDVLERLHESWIDVYLLKRFGEVQIVSDGHNYEVELFNN